MNFDPYSIEVRYTLDFLVFCLSKYSIKSIRLVTDSPEMALPVARRLPSERYTLFVENAESQRLLQEEIDYSSSLYDPANDQPDAVLFPFSLKETQQLHGEEFVFCAAYNAFSYKSLLNPGKIKTTAFRTARLLNQRYQLHPAAALYSPSFVLWYGLAQLANRLHSSLYFQAEAYAMSRLINYSWLWRLSYIVLFTGRAAIQG